VKLTLKIKLLPSEEQAKQLQETILEANACCNALSDIAWDEKVFHQFKLHKRGYYVLKDSFNLSSQMVVRCIAKVADAYRLDRKTKRIFRPLGSIAYDSRLLTYKPNDIVSIWTVEGRQKIAFVCHNRNYLPYIKGEADLVFKKGKFFLLQTVDVPDQDIEDVEEFIGVDFGLLSIATTSDGTEYSSKELTQYREKRQKVRSSLQSKGTKNARRVLKRLSGKERTHGTIVNHTISKAIVKRALSEGKGIAIENLKNIRFSANRKGKKFRSRVGKWSFYQLRQFLTYKAALAGIPLIDVPPAYTSQTCSSCLHIGNRNGKRFTCDNCGAITDADVNAAKVISLLAGSVNIPEESAMYCSLHTC
jgi:putative transposase